MDRGSVGWVLVVEEAALPRYCLAQIPVCPSRKSYISGACSPVYLFHGGLTPIAVLKMCSHLTFLFLMSDGAP